MTSLRLYHLFVTEPPLSVVAMRTLSPSSVVTMSLFPSVKLLRRVAVAPSPPLELGAVALLADVFILPLIAVSSADPDCAADAVAALPVQDAELPLMFTPDSEERRPFIHVHTLLNLSQRNTPLDADFVWLQSAIFLSPFMVVSMSATWLRMLYSAPIAVVAPVPPLPNGRVPVTGIFVWSEPPSKVESAVRARFVFSFRAVVSLLAKATIPVPSP